MACNRRNRCGWNDTTTDPFVPWAGCAACNPSTACGTAHTTCGGCTACGRAFNFDNACPFLNGCGYPMTYDEMLNLLAGLRYARLAVCVNGVAYVMPVCFSVRNCDGAPIFTLRVRTDGAVMNHLRNGGQVTLQFDRAVNGGVCTVQAQGTAHVTGSTGCVAIIEVHTDSMMGECFRNNNCGCNCTTATTNGCDAWNTGCGNGCAACGGCADNIPDADRDPDCGCN